MLKNQVTFILNISNKSVLKKNSRIIFFLFFWWNVLTPNFLNTFKHPVFLDFLDESLLLILTLYLIAVLIKRDKKLLLFNYLKYGFILYILVIIISYLLNGTNIWALVQFLFIYYRPVIIVLFTVLYFNLSDVNFFIKNILILFFIQIILNYTWIIGINPIPHWKHFVDISTGTFESVMPVAYLCVFMLYFIIGKKLVANDSVVYNRYLNSNPIEYILIILILIQLYITFTSHAIILGIIGIAGFIFYKPRPLLKYLLSILLLFIIINYSLKRWESKKFYASTDKIISVENIVTDRMERLQGSIKIISFYRVLFNDVPEIKSPLLGAGPGRYASLVASRGSDLYRKYNDVDRLKNYGINYRDITSVTGGVQSGALALLGDIGWLGLIIFFSFIIYGLHKTVTFIKSDKFHTIIFPELFISFIPSLIFYLLLDIIWDMGAFKIISIGFWVWFGLIMKEIYVSNKRETFNSILIKRI